MAKEVLTGEYYALFDDLSMGFSDGVGYVGSVDKECVLQIYVAIKELVEEKLKADNSDYIKCSCPCPSLPVGFTVLEPKNVLCKKCGEHII